MARNSRDNILESLRSTALEEVPLPDIDAIGTEFDDCRRRFQEVLTAGGGQAVEVRDLQHLNAELEQLETYREARKVCSLVPGINRANVGPDDIDDPHDFEDIDFFVAAGEFGVAENAAVWVTDQPTRHRVLYFICQHMALVVPADSIVSTLHQAYERLSFDERSFGLFLSGPSKTADIEQSLVIGAHGARSLTVFLLGPSA